MTIIVGCIFLAYLLGSLSSAIIICKTLGITDPRQFGSGNPGATNVLRSGNKPAAAAVLLSDAAKGWFAVIIAHLMGATGMTQGIVALAVVLGHIFPLFHQFKGGRGVATAWGAIAGLSLWMGISLLFTWMVLALIWRYSSLAALGACIASPIFATFLLNPQLHLPIIAISVMLFYTHAENINRLLAGTESKIGDNPINTAILNILRLKQENPRKPLSADEIKRFKEDGR